MANLENLSPIDFEELCRDLAQADTGNRFSAFGPGPDGGIDGRHSKGDDTIILQCKHYLRSSFSDLKTALTKEVKKIQKLTPVPIRYLFFTSYSLSPDKSGELAEICSPYLQQPGDIWGREDIEAAIKRNPEIEKSHIKLWLSSTAVLERILMSGLEAFTQSTNEDICEDLRVYVRSPSFDEATKILEQEKILIISGSPGVGKTTLARMITYYYLNESWRFVAINSLDQGFSKIDNNTPTIFFFDDFLGRVELNKQSLSQNESVFGAFVKRIRRTKNSRFILTTRAHIFEEARLMSDYVDDGRLQLAKYVLDVGEYTRRIKSHILFNHLNISELTQEHFAALLKKNWLKRIVDHKNYNPRLIASVSSNCLDDVNPEQYPSYVLQALQNPDLLWSKPFGALHMKCQNLLICLFFSNEYGELIDNLKINYSDIHRLICKHHSQPSKPSDFETALQSLESGFITIFDGFVRFINPSVRDFLKSHLKDMEFLSLLPAGAKRAYWAENLWSHVTSIVLTVPIDPESYTEFARKFVGFTSIISDPLSDDLCLANRVKLLLSWGGCSGEDTFIKCALELLQSSELDLEPRNDCKQFIELYSSLLYDEQEVKDTMKQDLMDGCIKRLIEILESPNEYYVSIDLLIEIIESVDKVMGNSIPLGLEIILESAVGNEFDEIRDNIDFMDTEQELVEHLDNIERLANLTSRDPTLAISIIHEKLSDLKAYPQEEESPDLPASINSSDEEIFKDNDLRSLFSNLIMPSTNTSQ